MASESPQQWAKKVAKVLGEGERMSVEEKQEYLESHQEKLHQNADFVSKETYVNLFKEIDLDNTTVVYVGAGYSLSPHDYRGLSPMIEALSSLRPKMTLIPVDYNHERTKSWLLLDTKDERKNDPIKLEPVTGDATALPFGDGTLDGYLSANLLNEPRTNEPESKFVRKMLSEAYRVIKPGGFLVISSFGYIWSENEEGEVRYNNDIDIEEIVPEEFVERMLTDAGFVSVRKLPLEDTALAEAVERTLKRREDAVRAGVQDACAFFARKPQV